MLTNRSNTTALLPTVTPQEHKAEINVYGGYVWTWSISTYVNGVPDDVDINNSGFWAIAADFNVLPFAQLELLYKRQYSQLAFKDARTGIKSDLVDVAVEYYHIGALKGVRKGNVLPFGLITLGATRLNYKGEGNDDDWEFSMIFGVGVGTGGVSGGFFGTGMAQIDVSGGLFIMFQTSPVERNVGHRPGRLSGW